MLLLTSVLIADDGDLPSFPTRRSSDLEIEGDESVTLTISESAAYNVGSPSNATLTIADNDGPPPPPEKPTVTVSATDAQAAEQGPDAGTFTISRAGDTSSDLAVNYSLGGTAPNGTDYERLGCSVTFAGG